MGESNSKPQVNSEFLRTFQTDYVLVSEQRDERLGNVKVFEGPHQQLVAEKNITASSKEDVEQFLQTNLKRSLEIHNRYLMKLHAYKVFQEDSMCGSISGVSTFHEYHQNTVQDELVRRNQVNLFYHEAELWAILYSIISAASYLEKNGNLPLTDVRPSTIYFTLNGEVKLLPFGIYLNDQSAYSKVFATNEPCLLSPEQLDRLRGAGRKELNGHVSDTYSIGMVTLIAATLQTAPDMYNYDEYTINEAFVNELFGLSNRQYSRFFNNILRVMLSTNPDERPTPSDIYAILQPFEAEILALKQFNPDYNIIKQAISGNARLTEKHQQSLTQPDEQQIIYESNLPQQSIVNPHSQLQQSAVAQLPILGDDGKIYYKPAPETQFQYLIQKEDGQPIQQIEQHFFYEDQPTQAVSALPDQSQVYTSYAQPAQQYNNVSYSQAIPTSQVYSQPRYIDAAGRSVAHYPSTYQPHQSQVIAQYSINVEDKPLNQTTTQVNVHPSRYSTPISTSNVNYFNQNATSQVQSYPVATETQHENVKRSSKQPQAEYQASNQDIYQNSIPLNSNIPYQQPQQLQQTFNYQQVQYTPVEPESPIGLATNNTNNNNNNNQGYTQTNYIVNQDINYQLTGQNPTTIANNNGTYTPSVASSTVQVRPQAGSFQNTLNTQGSFQRNEQTYTIPQQNQAVYTTTTTTTTNVQQPQSGYDMNDINRRINEALQRTQDVISNSSAPQKV